MGEAMGFRRAGKRFFYIIVVANVLLLIVNIFLIVHSEGSDQTTDQSEEFPLLSKRIFAEHQNDILIHFTPLRMVIEEYVEEQEKIDGEIGLYFEYLPSGTSIGVNSDAETKIASLVKVPTVMAIYKNIEDGELSLKQQVTLQKEDLATSYGDLWKKGEGYTMTLEEAIDYTLIESDNTAHEALKRLLSEADITAVLQELNIPLTEEKSHFIISPKNYTSILRSLYLSAFLQRESSNAILDTLTRSKFNDKIAAGVPDYIPVAHKIGVFSGRGTGEQPVYSDCGIIYLPSRPYTLCIMIRGDDETRARQHMKNLSSLTYGYVSEVR